MSTTIKSVCSAWADYINALDDLPILCDVKAFRDQFICDESFRKGLNEDCLAIIKNIYPKLKINDVHFVLPRQVKEKLGKDYEPSTEALALKSALETDKLLRRSILEMEPAHLGWREWRNNQINRYRREDQSIRCKQITFIPFAIELTKGCSGMCSFCGLSAEELDVVDVGFESAKDIYKHLLSELHRLSGPLAVAGVLYWATDPFDHPEYESFSELYAEEFGLWPATTTATGELNPQRLISLTKSEIQKRPWGLRCSLRSHYAFKKIFKTLSPRQRACISFIPQYKGSLSIPAIAGRAYDPLKVDQQLQDGGTIACMSGLLISIPSKEVRLITPCIAEPNHLNGYRTLAKCSFTSKKDLSEALDWLTQMMPCPNIELDTLLKITIDRSQFHLYESTKLVGLLECLFLAPASLRMLIAKSKGRWEVDNLFKHCLELIQHGVIITL